MPQFSIIIPLYNKEKFLEKTLNSVFDQTFDDYEIIVVNDGSTDDSLNILNRFLNNKIKIYNQENQGVSSARNLGIEKSSAPFCCFLDADDLWKNNHLQTLFDLTKKFPEAGMFCSRYEIQITKNKIITPSFDFENSYEGYVFDFFKSSMVNRVALTSTVCINKKIHKEINGFNISVNNGEDLDFWIRIALNYKVAISNKTTAFYNHMVENHSLSKLDIENRSLPDLDKYGTQEKLNSSLKDFLDLYRIEFALHFHISGNQNKKKFYLKNVSPENISSKTKLLLKLPPVLLRKLLFFKRYLKQFGIDFSVYH